MKSFSIFFLKNMKDFFTKITDYSECLDWIFLIQEILSAFNYLNYQLNMLLYDIM